MTRLAEEKDRAQRAERRAFWLEMAITTRPHTAFVKRYAQGERYRWNFYEPLRAEGGYVVCVQIIDGQREHICEVGTLDELAAELWSHNRSHTFSPGAGEAFDKFRVARQRQLDIEAAKEKRHGG